MADIGTLLLGVFSLWQGAKNVSKGLGLGEADEPRSKKRKMLVDKGQGKMRVEMHNVRSIEERIRHIVKMIQKGKTDKRVIKLTRQIVNQRCGDTWCVPEKDWKAEAVAVFTTLRSRYYRYCRDTYGVDLFVHPRRTLEFGGGDCDDGAILLGAMLQSIGFKIWLRVIRTHDSDDWNHIYVIAEIPAKGGAAGREGRSSGSKMALDLSVNQPPGWEAPRELVAARRDFLVP